MVWRYEPIAAEIGPVFDYIEEPLVIQIAREQRNSLLIDDNPYDNRKAISISSCHPALMPRAYKLQRRSLPHKGIAT
jgi:hypothetical protein